MRLPMTAVHSRQGQRRTMQEEDDDSPAKCRERRRRRIERRRLGPPTAAGPSSSASPAIGENPADVSEGKRIRTEGVADPMSSSSGDEVEAFPGSPSVGGMATRVPRPATDVTPVYGMMSVAGRSRDMEDAIHVQTNLCRPEFNRRLPVHYFGVYDGHGGTHVKSSPPNPFALVAALCKDRMHLLMEEALMRVGQAGAGSSSRREPAAEGLYRAAMRRCFERMDQVALSTCACGSIGYLCGCHPMEVALSGSTAVVALVTANHLVVANCGDSRAVLCRGGRAVPLSEDHKVLSTKSMDDVGWIGGFVLRKKRDKYLKPFVISEPDITFTKRHPKDECLILASDGLWDVLSNDLACEIASECLREGSPPAAPRMQEDEGAAAALFPSRSASAAVLLTRLALGRRSSDNISVIVVDLKRR
ncbi:hypothetical protein RHGRI_008409 [Rhododendron griersonianum]|uniref:protein-serine/threonine phosphatase n=1 Tax=Rhododendron griersonianum TaxID=479676 RepID=A0AAV6L065_9ERIC|nr:hypothetical protein RHGRI_008409 [Rhododendron griersonianum]